jgi:hypothetical protein
VARTLVNPILNLRYECRGAFHGDGATSRYVYSPRCQSCQNTYGHPFDLHNPEELEAWLARSPS